MLAKPTILEGSQAIQKSKMHSTTRESPADWAWTETYTRRDFLNGTLLASGGLLLTSCLACCSCCARAGSLEH